MAESKSNRVVMASDLLYFLTFATGIAVFWASGHVPKLIGPYMPHGFVPSVLSIIITNGLFALGMLMLAIVLTRHLGKAAIIATAITFVLGVVTAQAVIWFLGLFVSSIDVSLLTFVFYLLYGGIYVASLAIGRRFER